MKNRDNKLKQQFGEIIRKLRLDSGLSQEEFAHQCGLHRTYIGSIERGEKNVTLETAYKIAKTLDTPLSHLLLLLEHENDIHE